MSQARFSACAYQLGFDRPEETLQMVSDAGFSGIEANDTVVEGRDEAAISDLGRSAVAHGAPFTSYHLPFTKDIDVAAFYETDRLRAVRSLSDAMRQAALLGAGTVILHPTTNSNDVRVEGAERYLDRLATSIEPLAQLAGELGLTIAVENMMNTARRCFFSQPEHIEAFRERVEHERVGFCLDTGHALISLGDARQLEMADAMRGRLVALHLQDTPGDRDIHIAPGHGRVDFRGLAAMLRSDGVDVVMCIETPPFTPERPHDLESWRMLVAETRALLEG